MTKTAIATPDRPDNDRPAGLDALPAQVADNIGTAPADEDGDRLAVVDGRNALAYVLISPGDQPGTVEVEAGSRGLAKPDAARVLREVARQWSPSPIPAALRDALAIPSPSDDRGPDVVLDAIAAAFGKARTADDCAFTLATGLPCPKHGAPAAEADTNEEPEPTPVEEPRTVADAVSEARQALDFNHGQHSPALSTLRDVLLSGDYRTPDQALAVAYVILGAHARELARQVADKYDSHRGRFGVTRSTRGLLTGIGSVRRLLDEHASALDVNATFAASLK
ncbi:MULTISPECIES: hypothetical protein [unclassified Streptomyces]|uniref:hypothetical protein n=1 Tax=unclassified Streptomyces TaxID=2593676 RepID=UPI00037F3D0E|nr:MULTISPECIES: hypothetical protein [unclassified Streptomyces]MYX36747.1 hypothetical protein [Streptomyces sp. SID8377]